VRTHLFKRAILIVATLSATMFLGLGGCSFKSIALGLLSQTLNGGSSLTSLLGQVTGSGT
jgi:hypothetical protein